MGGGGAGGRGGVLPLAPDLWKGIVLGPETGNNDKNEMVTMNILEIKVKIVISTLIIVVKVMAIMKIMKIPTSVLNNILPPAAPKGSPLTPVRAKKDSPHSRRDARRAKVARSPWQG